MLFQVIPAPAFPPGAHHQEDSVPPTLFGHMVEFLRGEYKKARGTKEKSETQYTSPSLQYRSVTDLTSPSTPLSSSTEVAQDENPREQVKPKETSNPDNSNPFQEQMAENLPTSAGLQPNIELFEAVSSAQQEETQLSSTPPRTLPNNFNEAESSDLNAKRYAWGQQPSSQTQRVQPRRAKTP
jgi:hypothetical protein